MNARQRSPLTVAAMLLVLGACQAPPKIPSPIALRTTPFATIRYATQVSNVPTLTTPKTKSATPARSVARTRTPTPAPPTATPNVPTPRPITLTPTAAPTHPMATLMPTATALPLDPLTIEAMRRRTYPGSALKIEQTLAPGSNYSRYIASYLSDGLKIYALLTIPRGTKPATGWPLIVFNHGFIPPLEYRTTERYTAYVDALASAGYVVFKSDYRGHGSSQGVALGGYGAPDYTVDVLNGLASVKQLPQVDPARIGMWGHSMGGQITLRSMVVTKDIKAGVIWAGVVGSYTNLLTQWHASASGLLPNSGGPVEPELPPTSGNSPYWRRELTVKYGTPETDPAFWESVSPNSYLPDLSGPIQLHHDTQDHDVPYEFAQELAQETKAVGKPAELYSYPGDDHNLTQSFDTAMKRTIQFFDKHVKQSK